MSFMPVEILSRVERRRRYTSEQKLAILAEANAAGTTASAVARKHGLLPSQIFKWRRLAELGVIGIAGASELSTLVAGEVGRDTAEDPARSAKNNAMAVGPEPFRSCWIIEIDFGDGWRVRVDRQFDADALARVLAVLSRR